jgi:hypothetical protein
MIKGKMKDSEEIFLRVLGLAPRIECRAWQFIQTKTLHKSV